MLQIRESTERDLAQKGRATIMMNDSEEEEGPRIKLLGREIQLPRSRLLRVPVGGALVFFGMFGFLPVLGFWMVPLGLFVLAYDFPRVRRFNRRTGIWIKRRYQQWRQ